MKTIGCALMLAGMALAQQQDVVIFNERLPVPGPGVERRAMFLGRSGGEAIKNAPYSADTITESTQVLGDGNRIKHENRSSFARDSEGRTRREMTIQGLGPLGRAEQPVTSIVIDDPVAKLHYVLDAKAKIAFKHKVEGPSNLHFRATPGGTSFQAQTIVLDGVANAAGPKISVTQVRNVVEAKQAKGVNQEELGLRTIEGVSAKGKRTKLTIAAGEVGNDRPIEVVTETWYSDELQAVVLMKHSDPRTGETVTRLENVKLGEPARHLFEVPADYKVEEPKMVEDRGPAPVFRVKEDR